MSRLASLKRLLYILIQVYKRTAELCTRLSISFGAELRLVDGCRYQETIDTLIAQTIPEMLGSKAGG